MGFKRGHSCIAALAAIAGFLESPGSAVAQSPGAKPNVIVIFTDDMGYADISSFATVPFPARTTNIDQMAAEGMKFTHFYVAMPICSPSRAAMLSGRFAPETGLTNYLQARDGNQASDQEDYMDPAHSHLPKTFQAGGYHTAHVGKWHLGGGRDVDNAPSISEYGFHEAYSTWESPNPDPEMGIKNPPWNTSVEAGQVPRHERTEYMVDRTLEILQRNADKPCFITLWPDDMHTPFWPSPEMAAKWGGVVDDVNTRQDFYGVLEEYDRQIGRLMAGLKSQGIDNNTIVVFTGDNGPAPDFGRERTNGMNGNKLSLYEGGIRQPFIIRWPGHVPAGTTNNRTIMSTIDLLPTLSALAGIPVLPAAAAVADGENLSAAVLGNTQLARTNPLMWEYGRTSQVPLPGPNDVDRSPVLAIREGDFKLLLNPDNTGHELYNVRTDVREDNNVASSNPALVQSLSAKVLAWRATLPHRTQPYPVFSTVGFGQWTAAPFVSATALQEAAGTTSTARIDGVALGPNGEDDIYVIHVDQAGNESFLRVDYATRAVTQIANSAQIAAALGSADRGLSPVAGFDYSPPGDRLFFADNSLGTGGEISLVTLVVGTGLSRLVKRGSDLAGLSDHSVLPDGGIAAVRGASGNRSVGSVGQATGTWTQHYSQAQLVAAAPGSTQIIPETIAANSSSGEVHVFSHEAPKLFRMSSITAGSAGVSLAEQPALSGIDLHDLASDQAGNVYGFDEAGQRIMVVRRADSSVFSVPLTAVSTQLGGGVQFTPTRWRGLAARMTDPTHSDLFMASSSPENGVVRVRFGQFTSGITDWALY